MARNQVIDLRRNFQPQQKSPIVEGFEGLMEGFNQQSQAIQKQKNTSQALEGLGFAREESEALSRLPEPVLLNVMKQLSERGYSGAPQGGASQGGSPQMQQIEQMFNANKSSPTQETLQGMSEQLRMPEGMRQLGMENQQPFQTQPQQQQMQQQQQPFQQQQPKTAAEALRMQPRREQREEEKLDIQRQKLSHLQEKDIREETKGFRTSIRDEAKSAKDNLKRLDRMEKLTKEGNLGSPLFNAVLKATNPVIDLSNWMTADAQELQKLTVDFIKGAKSYFGSRITQREVEMYLQSIPNLSQSKQGRLKVIENNKIMNQAALVKDEAMRSILKENRGRVPFDLEDQLEDRTKKELDKLSERFVAGLSLPSAGFGKSKGKIASEVLGLSY